MKFKFWLGLKVGISITHFYCNSSHFGFCFLNKIYNLIRNGNGLGFFFFKSEPATWARTHYPNPACLINKFFYGRPDPPCRASFSPTKFRPKSCPNNFFFFKKKKKKIELKPVFIFAQIQVLWRPDSSPYNVAQMPNHRTITNLLIINQ